MDVQNESGTFSCFGTFNPNTQQWEQLANSPHDGFTGLWPMDWPEARHKELVSNDPTLVLADMRQPQALPNLKPWK